MLKFCWFLEPTWPSKSTKNRRFEGQVGLSWHKLGLSWDYLAPSWPKLAQLEAILSDLETQVGPSWAKLGQVGSKMSNMTLNDPKDTQKHPQHKPVINRTGSAFARILLSMHPYIYLPIYLPICLSIHPSKKKPGILGHLGGMWPMFGHLGNNLIYEYRFCQKCWRTIGFYSKNEPGQNPLGSFLRSLGASWGHLAQHTPT